jgi:hypothetical protein
MLAYCDLVIMDELIETSKAENDLRDRWNELTAEGVRDRVMAITGSQDKADLAFAERSIAINLQKMATQAPGG